MHLIYTTQLAAIYMRICWLYMYYTRVYIVLYDHFDSFTSRFMYFYTIYEVFQVSKIEKKKIKRTKPAQMMVKYKKCASNFVEMTTDNKIGKQYGWTLKWIGMIGNLLFFVLWAANI